MKNIIAAILVICMSFMLCAAASDSTACSCGCDCGEHCECRTRALTEEEREKIYYEVAAEKALLNTSAAIPQDAITVEGTISQEIPAPTYGDYLLISAVKLEQESGTIYRPNAKVTCLFPDKRGFEYPDTVQFDFNYIDENGDIIKSVSVHVDQPAFGQSGWTKSTGRTLGDDRLDISEVKSIKILNYKMWKKSSWSEKWRFLVPVEFEISDLLPKETIDAAKQAKTNSEVDPISIESVSIVKNKINMKIRNTGEYSRDVIILHPKVLDKNGDILTTTELYVKELEAGQAGPSYCPFSLGCDINEIGSIQVTDYSYGLFNGSNHSSWTTPSGNTFPLNNPIMIPIDQISIG